MATVASMSSQPLTGLTVLSPAQLEFHFACRHPSLCFTHRECKPLLFSFQPRTKPKLFDAQPHGRVWDSFVVHTAMRSLLKSILIRLKKTWLLSQRKSAVTVCWPHCVPLPAKNGSSCPSAGDPVKCIHFRNNSMQKIKNKRAAWPFLFRCIIADICCLLSHCLDVQMKGRSSLQAWPRRFICFRPAPILCILPPSHTVSPSTHTL